jgi:hypothetical protein
MMMMMMMMMIIIIIIIITGINRRIKTTIERSAIFEILHMAQ